MGRSPWHSWPPSCLLHHLRCSDLYNFLSSDAILLLLDVDHIPDELNHPKRRRSIHPRALSPRARKVCIRNYSHQRWEGWPRRKVRWNAHENPLCFHLVRILHSTSILVRWHHLGVWSRIHGDLEFLGSQALWLPSNWWCCDKLKEPLSRPRTVQNPLTTRSLARRERQRTPWDCTRRRHSSRSHQAQEVRDTLWTSYYTLWCPVSSLKKNMKIFTK